MRHRCVNEFTRKNSLDKICAELRATPLSHRIPSKNVTLKDWNVQACEEWAIEHTDSMTRIIIQNKQQEIHKTIQKIKISDNMG